MSCKDSAAASSTTFRDPGDKLPFLEGKTPNAFTENLIRWIVPAAGKLEKLIACRNSSMSTIPSQNNDANCIRELNFVGITQNSVFKDIDTDVAKFKYKINSTKKIRLLPNGLQIRLDYLKELEVRTEARRHLGIAVYYIPVSVACKLGIQVRKRRRNSRSNSNEELAKKKQQFEEENIIPVGKSSGIDKCFEGRESCSESGVSVSTESSAMVLEKMDYTLATHESFSESSSSISNNINLSCKVEYSWESESSNVVHDSISLAKFENIQISHNEDSYPFDSALTVSLEGLKWNSGFSTSWNKNHPCVLLLKFTEARGVKIITEDINSINLKSKGHQFTKVDSVLFDGPMNKILLQVVQFHKKFKNVYKLFINCVNKWVIVLEKKEARKATRKNKISDAVSTLEPSVTAVNGIMENSADSPDMFASSEEENNVAAGTFGETQFKTFGDMNEGGGEDSKKKTQDEKRLKSVTKLNNSVPHGAILSGISQILKMSGLSQILGTNRNVKGFMKFIKRYIFLGGKYCVLPLKFLTESLSIEGVKWIPEFLNSKLKWYLLAKVSSWMVTRYVCVLLRSAFYVTETSAGRNQLGFYKRSSWISLTESLKHKYKVLGTLKQVPQENEVTGKLRFMPKKNGGVRPICSFTKEHKANLGVTDGAKMLLKYLSSAIAPHANTDSANFHLQWKTFLGRWNSQGRPKLYYLRTDIANAYPSVSIDLLCRILADALTKRKVLYHQTYKRKVKTAKGEVVAFKEVISKSPTDIHSYVKDRPWCSYVLKSANPYEIQKDVKAILDSLSPPTVSIGRMKYTFQQGLFQGSVVSQFLCSIYYGFLEQKYFGDFLQPREMELVYRVVDDYLFVSWDKARVEGFHKVMRATKTFSENSEHVFKINVEKTVHNLNPGSDADCTVSFWGWRLNLNSGHISRDYSSYEGTDVCATLSTNLTAIDVDRELEFIGKRMKLLTPLRICASVMDPEINCIRQIRRNVMDIGVMAGFRFYGMLRILNSNPIYMEEQSVCTQLFLALSGFVAVAARLCIRLKRQCIREGQCIPVYTCEDSESTPLPHSKFVRSMLRKSSQKCKKKCLNIDSMEKKEFKLILFYGILRKLMKHASIFSKSLIPKIKRKIKILADDVGYEKTQEIFNCVDAKLPVWFERMRK